MVDQMSDLPDVHFGSITAKPKDWRAETPEADPDDEELTTTPPEVVKILGFDPLHENSSV